MNKITTIMVTVLLLGGGQIYGMVSGNEALEQPVFGSPVVCDSEEQENAIAAKYDHTADNFAKSSRATQKYADNSLKEIINRNNNLMQRNRDLQRQLGYAGESVNLSLENGRLGTALASVPDAIEYGGLLVAPRVLTGEQLMALIQQNWQKIAALEGEKVDGLSVDFRDKLGTGLVVVGSLAFGGALGAGWRGLCLRNNTHKKKDLKSSGFLAGVGALCTGIGYRLKKPANDQIRSLKYHKLLHDLYMNEAARRRGWVF